MIWATLIPKDPVTVSPGLDKPVAIHAVRDAGEPSNGEPIRLFLDVADAKLVIEGLQAALLKLEGK